MIFEMLRWWYSAGLQAAVRRIPAWIMSVEHLFSLGILIRTLFAPWKRIIADPGRGLDAKLHAGMDNLVSRCIGFVIRIFVIIAALVSTVGAFITSTILAILWPLLPLLVIVLIVKGITG